MGGAKLRLRSSISSPPTLRRHVRIMFCTGEKGKKTQPNEIAQFTDHRISRTNNVPRYWFVSDTKFKRRSLHGNEQGEKNS
jgi:hypothetical protein